MQVAYSGQEVIRLFEAKMPQVALLDIGMPEMDGYQSARHLRLVAEGQRVMLVTTTG